MDSSFAPYRPGRAAATPATIRAVRGLRVPDFNARPEAEDEAAAEAERAERAMLVAAARAEGHALGVAEGRRQQAETESAQVAAALAAVAAAMQGAVAAASAAVDEASGALARLLMAALDAALPAASARLATETATLLAAALKPALDEIEGLRLRVAPGLGEACAAAIGDPRIEVVEDAALAPGDARATWRGGAATMELARQREKVAEVLRTLGLGE